MGKMSSRFPRLRVRGIKIVRKIRTNFLKKTNQDSPNVYKVLIPHWFKLRRKLHFPTKSKTQDNLALVASYLDALNGWGEKVQKMGAKDVTGIVFGVKKDNPLIKKILLSGDLEVKELNKFVQSHGIVDSKTFDYTKRRNELLIGLSSMLFSLNVLRERGFTDGQIKFFLAKIKELEKTKTS